MKIEIETTVERTVAVFASEFEAMVPGSDVFPDQFVSLELLYATTTNSN